jgi:hypothetical protein
MKDSFKARRKIAETLLGQITWDQSGSKGECKCPGASFHTNPGEAANIFVDGRPTIHCFHQSCEEKVEETNTRLRTAIASIERNSSEPQNPPPGFKPKASKKDSDKQRLLMLARANLNGIVADNPFHDSDEWIDRSPISLPEDSGGDDWRLLLGQLPIEERFWIGQQYDSGSPEHVNHFQTAQEWMSHEQCPGPLICPANFKEGSFQRSEEQVVQNHFIIVESDKLTKPEISSVFLWLSSHWHLFAIVDTGNKSLHGWFEKPEFLTEEIMAVDRTVLAGLGCDPAMFRPAQPCRLPSWIREETKRRQHLLYLDHLRLAIPTDLSLNS